MSQNLNPSKTNYSNDFVVVRVDLTLKETMEQVPSSRWDADYWHPKWDSLYQVKLPLVDFGQLIQEGGITYGQVGERVLSSRGSVRYLQVINLKPTGIDIYVRDDKLKEGSRNDPARSRLKPGQILLTRTSFPEMDTLIGRCIVVPEDIGKANVSEDIDVISLNNIVSPEVICTFLKTKYGQDQIHRKKKGTKSIKINFDEICSIKIPVFSDDVMIQITQRYRQMASLHSKAMLAKAQGDEKGYEKNIEAAENIRKDLIAKTEAVMRDERTDVV